MKASKLGPKIFPVIHFVSRAVAIEQAGLARQGGADGCFVISHHGNDAELLEVAAVIQKEYAGFPVGINLLSTGVVTAFNHARSAGFPMLWGDDVGVDSDGLSDVGRQVVSSKKGSSVEVFASVAFKYRPHEAFPEQAAKNALEAGFIPTTSGAATGAAPELGKIVAMSKATGGTLAIASGMTPENVSVYAPYLSHILVATGIAIDEHTMDVGKLQLLIKNSRQFD